jgi:hypothetical protein
MSEMKKEKYEKTDFYEGFQRLSEELLAIIDPDAFITLQDKLLADVKNTHEAETILRRKIKFFLRLDQKKKAWDIIKENMQIESFRLKVVRRKIKKQNFKTAKKLINDFINAQGEDTEEYFNDIWHELLLDIAKKEKDIPAVRKLTYGFIKKYFDNEYYQIYKATFSPAEWTNEREKLFLHYSGKKGFSSSAADFLVAENEIERLINYVEKYLSMYDLERYYKLFASDYPEKTLEMFKKALISYTDNNTGRYHYEHILSLLKSIKRIKGGKKAASDLVAYFRIHYKNRRAMMEVLNGF